MNVTDTTKETVVHVIVSLYKMGCFRGFLILSDSLYQKVTRRYVEKADTMKASPEIFDKQGESPIFDFVSQRDKFLRCCQHKQNIVFQELAGDSHSELLLMDNCVA